MDVFQDDHFPQMQDKRQHPRYRLRWPTAIFLDLEPDGGPVIEGRLFDLSLGGASVLTEVHLRKSGKNLALLIAPPPLIRGGREERIITHCRMIYSVYASDSMCFRVGLQFLSFEGQGRAILSDRLTYHLPTIDRSHG